MVGAVQFRGQGPPSDAGCDHAFPKLPGVPTSPSPGRPHRPTDTNMDALKEDLQEEVTFQSSSETHVGQQRPGVSRGKSFTGWTGKRMSECMEGQVSG